MINLSRTIAVMCILLAVATGCTKSTLEEGQSDDIVVATDTAIAVLETAAPTIEVGEPTITVKIDEERDTVSLTANRDLERASIELSIQTTIHDVRAGGALDYLYAVEWSDDRHATVRFKELPPEASVGFMLDDARTKDGKTLAITLPEEGRRVITVHAGEPWSGVRWTNVEGQVVKEQPIPNASFIQAACCEWGDGVINVYLSDGNLDQLDPDTGDVSRTKPVNWQDIEVSRGSDSGTRDLYAYPADGESYYIAKGMEYVYLVDPESESRKAIYRSQDAAIYGLASSPDGSKVAVLIDSNRNLGTYADMLIFDASGNQLSLYEKATYIGHSDGFHFVYPAGWLDNDRVALLNMGRSDMNYLRGKLIYDTKKGTVTEQESGVRPEEVISCLQEALPGWPGDEIDIFRLLPRPGDEAGRYYAAYITGHIPSQGTYLIDVQTKSVTRAGLGIVLGWNRDGNLLTWYSSEENYPEVSVLD
ncbi:hypothetical protein ACX1C1_11460 [Paenibacillus sp. strain BS8-2]